MLLGYPRHSLAGIGVPWVLNGTHRCALTPKVAIKAKRQPFVVGVVVKTCGLGRGRRDVLSCTFCQLLELRILTFSGVCEGEARASHRGGEPALKPHQECGWKAGDESSAM